MPKATALWLIENTSLTFQQISDFCGLHMLEVESLADGDMDSKMTGLDPIVASQLTSDEIKRCEEDSDARLRLKPSNYNDLKVATKKYTPRSKRHDKPDAIAWILKYYHDVPEVDICNLIGTTKKTIKSIKNKTHKNTATLKPRSPVVLGLCSDAELDCVIAKLSRD
jgi:hypothetical protein